VVVAIIGLVAVVLTASLIVLLALQLHSAPRSGNQSRIRLTIGACLLLMGISSAALVYSSFSIIGAVVSCITAIIGAFMLMYGIITWRLSRRTSG
jgi:hypothetical protein